jgi:hypothetical protein
MASPSEIFDNGIGAAQRKIQKMIEAEKRRMAEEEKMIVEMVEVNWEDAEDEYSEVETQIFDIVQDYFPSEPPREMIANLTTLVGKKTSIALKILHIIEDYFPSEPPKEMVVELTKFIRSFY